MPHAQGGNDKDEIRELRRELQELQAAIGKTRKNRVFGKLGDYFRRGKACVKEYGIRYTWKRFWQKVHEKISKD